MIVSLPKCFKFARRHILQLILLSAHGEDGLWEEDIFFLIRALVTLLVLVKDENTYNVNNV